MPQSISEDLGKTWEYSASPFHPIEGGQRLVLLRLKEGPLFFASFAREPDDNDEFFPPLVLKDDSGKQTPVKGLFAALSYDEGKSWSRMKLLTDTKKEQTAKTTDGREFTMSPTSAEPQGYLSICQGGNGLIHLISSWNHYTFNLKWLETGPFIHFSE
jgi:sulfatase modifying factor 1